MTLKSEPEVTRAQLVWHCRRGMRELDVLLMRYVDTAYDAADESEQKSFHQLLSLQDPEILDLLTGRLVAEDAGLRHVIERLLKHSRSADI
ncbi:MAG: succinate dehydrogenase assembly factor 2 [Gammaproteobacteria bacterium]|nr:succinate dehydrogenase assembly factor 2 [Gammaproteobacteria bacterium]